VSGGRSPYLFSLNGQAPAGLVFDNATGHLNGTPDTADSFRLGVTAIDADGRSAVSGLQNLVIAPGAPPPQQDTLAFANLPSNSGQLGVGYLSHVTATGGTQPYTFSSAGAALPPGLSLAADGTLSGTPTAIGTFSGIRISVADAVGGLAESDPLTITISAPPALLIAGNPSSSAQVGVSYQADFTAFDGTGTGYTFSLVAGSLPPGLTLADVGGAQASIVGTPTKVGTFSGLQVRVTDSGGDNADSGVFSIAVAAPAGPPLAITGEVPNFASIGVDYNATLVASGGSGTGYAFSLAGGALPSGLLLGSNGTISGSPTAAGSGSFTVQVTDPAGDVATSTAFSIVVSPATASASLSPPASVHSSAAITGTLSTSLPSPAWSFVTTPPGLTLTASGSAFSGTAPAVGSPTTYSVVATATEGGNSVSAAAFSVTVTPAINIAGGPSGAIAGVVGDALPATSAPTVSDAIGTLSLALLENGTPVTLASLCAGLSFDTTDGVVSGIPTAACSLGNLTIQATDSADGSTAMTSPAFAISVAGDTATASPTSPATVRSGAPIAGTLSTNLASPVWSFVSTPTGLTLTASGSSFSGTAPTVAVSTTYSVTATATHGSFSHSVAAFSLTVIPPLAVSAGPSGTLNGVVGNAFTTTATTVAGAQSTISYALLSSGSPITLSSVCPGLSFSASSGMISGTPTAICSIANLAIKVTDSFDGATATTTPTFAIVVAGDTATATLTSAATIRQGRAVTGTLSTNLVSPVWSLVSTPAGLTLTASGSSFSGTAPSVASPTTYSVTATATHGSFSHSVAAFSLTVIPPLAVSAGPSGTLSGTVGTAVSASTAPTVANLIGTATYGLLESGSAVTLSSVCPGLSFSASSGMISGTPTAACSTGTTLTIQVIDGSDSTTAKTSTPFGITATTPVSNAFAWGFNDADQIGDGTTTNRLSPVNVIGGKTFTQISAGNNHSCGLVNDGTIQCWGGNSVGQLGNGTATATDTPVTVPGITGATAVSAGDQTTCAIVSGAAKCWGLNANGQIGDGTTTSRSTPTQVPGLTSGVTAISAGTETTCAIVAGAAKCWGLNDAGEIGDGTMTNRLTPTQVSGLTSGVTAISAGTETTCAIVAGAAKCWGNNGKGQIGDGTTTTRLTPTQVSGLTSGVTAISSSDIFTCAIVSGAAKCWGLNDAGEIGDGTTTNRSTPTQVSGLTSGVTAISGGEATTCAVVSGAAKCWGFNNLGQIGDGTTTNRSTPTQVSGLMSGVTAISAGNGFSLAK
jgi:alpha-tubulin suppressor-like RCC1 family protein